MLRGIDISNWQAGMDLNAVLPNVDFVICKATEGDYFTDPYCKGWVEQCIAAGKPWGFYHFAGGSDPIAEAAFFINQTSNYFTQGIPVLDWEGSQSVEWVNAFVEKVHEQTGLWPWIYGNPWRFNQGGVNQNCGRWVASYPDVIQPGLDYDPGEPPETDGLICCWQYASDGQVGGYAGNLDVDHFFGNATQWSAYVVQGLATPEPDPETSVLENEEYKVVIQKK